jgi:hypothetical protein
MSEDVNPLSTGPVMLSMTSALKPPPARIAKLGNNVVLPRSIPLLQAAAGIVGALVGLIFTTIFIIPFFGATLTTFGLGAGVFGGIGVLVVSWSPLRGESFAKWIGLSLEQIRLDRVEIDGIRAKAYIGVAPLHCSALGKVRIGAGAAEVVLGSVDDRGVIIPHAERRKEMTGGQGGRLPGAEEGFEYPRWLADGEQQGDLRRAGAQSATGGSGSAHTVTDGLNSAHLADLRGSTGAGSPNAVHAESRWDAPSAFSKPVEASFEPAKKLPATGRSGKRRRRRN